LSSNRHADRLARSPLTKYCGAGKLSRFIRIILEREILSEFRYSGRLSIVTGDENDSENECTPSGTDMISESDLPAREEAPETIAEQNQWRSLFLEILVGIRFTPAEHLGLVERFKSPRERTPGISRSAHAHRFRSAERRIRQEVHRSLIRRGLMKSWNEL